MWWLRVNQKKFEEAGSESSFVDTTGGAPAVGEPAGESTDSDVNWGDLDNEFSASDNEGFETVVEGDNEVVGEPAPAVPASEPAPAPAQAPAPAATPTPTVPPFAPAVPPSSTPTPAPSAPAGEPSPQPNYQEWRANKEVELAEKTYSINDEDAAKLLTEPETVLPRMAARMHMEVMENAMRAVQAMIPQMMRQVQNTERVENSAKNLFAEKNPDLVDPKLEPVILELGMVYRRVNPSTPADVAAVAIGNLVRASLGMVAPQPAGVPPGVVAAPMTTPAVPFTPARGGSGVTSLPPSNDVWGRLAAEFDADDN